MIIILSPSELRRKKTQNEPATKNHRVIITPQLSVLIEVRWKPWEATGNVTAAWVEIRYFADAATELWTRLGEYPLEYIARSYERDEGADEAR